jgi:hypothetical protein
LLTSYKKISILKRAYIKLIIQLYKVWYYYDANSTSNFNEKPFLGSKIKIQNKNGDNNNFYMFIFNGVHS